ncbi:MAG: hypothetical protein RR678_10620 [Lachnospiraceae bacterium]
MRKFDNMSDAKEALLMELKEKYSEEFQIKENEKFSKTGYVYVYSCKVVPVNNEERLFSARITSSGDDTDNYSIYEFYNEMVSLVDSSLKSKTYIEHYEVKPTMGWTTNKWENESYSLQEFLEESEAFNEIIVTFSDRKTEEEKINDIFDLVSGLSGIACPIRLNVKVSDGYIFTEEFESRATPLTKTEIKENMSSTKRGRLIEIN